MHRVYLASPYSHPDPKVRHQRYIEVCKASALLITRGLIVFSPIAHSHGIAVFGRLRTDHTFWTEIDRTFLDWADCLYILAIDGWQDSKGIKREIFYALRRTPPMKIYKLSFVNDPIELQIKTELITKEDLYNVFGDRNLMGS